MLATLLALFVRIVSNPVANSIQKLLANKYSAILINVYSYTFLSLFCFYPAITQYSWATYSIEYWFFVCVAGVLCTLGSVCLIKALQYGEMSVLGPINSYKCLVGLIIAAVLLGEIPTGVEVLGVLLIIYGSWYIFDTVDGGCKLSLFKRKDIILRFLALLFTGCEAVVLKKIILMSSVVESFILWCFSGLIFSLVLMFIFRIKPQWFSIKNICYVLGISIGLGLMQLSTNYVFERLDVGLSLALFQLSGVISVFFGWKIFNEHNIKKKVLGTLIMLVGSCFILIK